MSHPHSGTADPNPEPLWRAGIAQGPGTAIADNVLVRGDVSGIQGTGISCDDSNNLTAVGSVTTANANGAALLSEASSSTNPTVAVDRADLTRGVGGTTGEVSLIVGGAEILSAKASQITFLADLRAANNNGPTADNSACSSTNPTLRPDRAASTTGLGGTGATPDLDLIVAGESMMNIADNETVFMRGLGLKRFEAVVTLETGGEESDVGLTPGSIILSAAIRVSTEIAGLDSADHHIELGINGDSAKYVDVAQGEASTTISVNKKGSYTNDPSLDTESAALKLTLTGGGDNTPSAGAVQVEVIYIEAPDLADV